jgi:hypothetical protein
MFFEAVGPQSYMYKRIKITNRNISPSYSRGVLILMMNKILYKCIKKEEPACFEAGFGLYDYKFTCFLYFFAKRLAFIAVLCIIKGNNFYWQKFPFFCGSVLVA